MNNVEKNSAVRRMQEYIMAHYQEEVTLPDLAKAAMYSPWHALRAFSELVGKTPFDYLRAVRLSSAAEGTENMDTMVVFTQVIERPARKLILKRGFKAEDYFAFCEEVGCDIWGILESIKGALYESIGLWLPEGMRKPGTSEYCQGVEVPADFSGTVPEGFDLIDLPSCKYLVFNSEPYEDDAFEEVIGATWEAIERYDPKLYGWDWAPEAGPRFQLAPVGARGYIEGVPVRELRK